MQIPSNITKNNSRGIIFVIISCQRVFPARATMSAQAFSACVNKYVVKN